MQDKATKMLDKKQVKRLSAVQKKANQLYSTKPFAVEFQRIYILATYLSPIVGFLSIAFASLYVYAHSEHFFTLIIGIALLGLFEYLKQVAFQEALRLWLKKRRWQAIPLFLCAALFLSLSVFCAYQGARQAIIHFENKIDLTSKDTQKQISAIKQQARNEIHRIDSLKTAYIQANSWRGTLIQKAEHLTAIANFDAEKKQITTYNASRIRALENQQQETQNAISAESQTYTPFVLALSLLIEGVILCCACFVPYYYYQTFEENTDIDDSNAWDLPYLTLYIKNAMQTFAAYTPTTASVGNPINNIHTATTASVEAQKTNSISPNSIGFYELYKNEQQKQVEKIVQTGNKTCLNCGKLFRYSIHNQKYCSPKCRYQAHKNQPQK
jgi:hypothetical protein